MPARCTCVGPHMPAIVVLKLIDTWAYIAGDKAAMAKHIADQLMAACSLMPVSVAWTAACQVCSVECGSMACAPAAAGEVLGSHLVVLGFQGAWRLTMEGGWQQLLLWLRQSRSDLLIVLENAEHALRDRPSSKVGTASSPCLRWHDVVSLSHVKLRYQCAIWLVHYAAQLPIACTFTHHQATCV